ncbi:hypothetical protein SCG7086_AB_00040 [Chlamydiales bacterium SCGC AG-110-P3]|nr:hypothetical protein SCG7086_AB_00040 [Chlamydiales bacterium SCGC AG-110-P3]
MKKNKSLLVEPLGKLRITKILDGVKLFSHSDIEDRFRAIPLFNVFYSWAHQVACKFLGGQSLPQNISQEAYEEFTYGLAISYGEIAYQVVAGKAESLWSKNSDYTPSDLICDLIEDSPSFGAWTRSLFEHFPGLEHHISVQTAEWFENLELLSSRLTKDKAVLQECMKGHQRLPSVCAGTINLNLYRKSSSSIILFENGNKIVYKQRYVGAELALNEILCLMNDLGFTPRMKTYSVIQKDGYGWCAFVKQKSCQSTRDVDQYYIQVGCLLFLSQLFNARDIHQKNIIAHGANPCIIDAEFLFHGLLEEIDSDGDDGDCLPDWWHESVLNSAILPVLAESFFGTHYISTGPNEEVAQRLDSVGWARIPRSMLYINLMEFMKKPLSAVPLFEGRECPLTEYTDPVIEGYLAARSCLLKDGCLGLHRLEELLIQLDPKVKVLLIEPNEYAEVISTLYAPETLQTVGNVSQTIQNTLQSIADRGLQTLELGTEQAQQERAFIQRGHIPRIYQPIDFANNPSRLKEFHRRVELLKSENFTKEQIKLIQASSTAYSLGFKVPFTPSWSDLQLDSTDPGLDTVLEQARCLWKLAQKAPGNKNAAWLAVEPNLFHQCWCYHPLSTNLAGGTTGLALFYAGVSSVTGSSQWEAPSVSSFRNLLWELSLMSSRKDWYNHSSGFGLYQGMAGKILTVYALAKSTNDQHLEELWRHGLSKVSDVDWKGIQENSLSFGLSGLLATLTSIPREELGEKNLKVLETLTDVVEERIRADFSPGGLSANTVNFSDSFPGIAYCLYRAGRYLNREVLQVFALQIFEETIAFLKRNSMLTENPSRLSFACGDLGIAYALKRIEVSMLTKSMMAYLEENRHNHLINSSLTRSSYKNARETRLLTVTHISFIIF